MTLTISILPTSLETAEKTPPRDRRHNWHTALLFAFLSTLYFTAGSVLVLRYNVFDGDGLSRVANAGFTVMSRDPHLSAIGFVWNPLPSLVEIPLLPLSHWWPALKTHGLAGIAQSAGFMAAAVMMLRQIAIDRGAGAVWRWVAVGCFAFNPLVILIAGYGLSEGATLFSTLWCARYLLRWVDSNYVGHLAVAGMALGVGYLARYEVLPSVCGVAVYVALVSFIRSPKEHRVPSTFLNVTIVVFPAAVAFLVWAVTGWIIAGDLFATLSSVYGNASQVATAHDRGGNTSFSTGNWKLISALLTAMQPFAGLAVVLAAVLAMIKRTASTLVPVTVFGSMLAFTVWGQFSGNTFNLFRYYLPAIPMVLVIALACWTPGLAAASRWQVTSITTKFSAALLSVSLLVATPLTTQSLFNADIGVRLQMAGFVSLFEDRPYPPKIREMGNDDRLLAAYLDRKQLPAGSILMDTFTSWLVWLASDYPKQFVVTSDYDFTAALNRPWDFGVQYIVVSNPISSATNAILLRWPSMWKDGAGIGELVHTAVGPTGDVRWKVYKVVKPPSPELAQPGG